MLSGAKHTALGVGARVATTVSETLRSLKNAPSHRPGVLREGDIIWILRKPWQINLV